MKVTHFTSTKMSRLIVLALTLGIVFGHDGLTFTADCRGDKILPCLVLQNCTKEYTSVTWYKLPDNSSDKSTKTIIKSNPNNSVPLDKNTSLVLRNVTPSDSGIYECAIRVKVGGTNCIAKYTLTVSDCTSTTPISFDSSTKFINESWKNISIPLPHVDDNLELFVIWGYVGLAMSKVVLCAVCIWGFNELRDLKRRRQFK